VSPLWRVHAALFTVQLLFGLWPVAGSVLMRQISPAALIGFRLALGAPLLVLASGLLTRPLPARRDLLSLAVVAALGIGINQLLFAEGLHRSDPVNASVSILLLPSITLVIALLLGLERARPLRLVGIPVALGGGALLVHVERFDLSDRAFVGNLMLLANVSAYAAFLVLAKPLFSRVGALPGMAWCFVLGGIEALPFTLRPTLAVPWASLDARTWGWLAFVLAGPTLGTYVLNAWALRRVESTLVAVYTNVQPVIAAAASFVVFGTLPAQRTLAAALIIALGVGLSAELWRARAPVAEPRSR
jgi:drug/metabolite transporter (DMT)-like permease